MLFFLFVTGQFFDEVTSLQPLQDKETLQSVLQVTEELWVVISATVLEVEERQFVEVVCTPSTKLSRNS